MLSETVPGARSVAFGVWVAVGSRDERPSVAGASHFLEHLLFKGTERRDAFEISEAMDAVGGESNAFTGKELTCFYARVLDEDLPLAVDVVVDQVLHSLVDAEDVEAEREVVLEEIAMHDDDPSDVVHDAFAAALFGGSPLGRPVIGSVESIEGLTPSSVRRWYRSRYTVPAMVVAAAGGLEHAQLLRLVRKAFGTALAGGAVPAPRRGGGRAPAARSAVDVRVRPTEQANLVLGTTALHRDDRRRPALQVLNAALGGGTSSRLFQTIREERGLAYSVYSSVSAYSDTGTFEVYAGCAPGKVREVLGLVRDELDVVAAKGLTDAEVARAKGALRGSLVLDLEDTGARMSRIGKAALLSDEVLSVDEALARTAAVTPDDVREVAADVLARPLALGAVGPFGDDDLTEAVR